MANPNELTIRLVDSEGRGIDLAGIERLLDRVEVLEGEVEQLSAQVLALERDIPKVIG